MYVLLWKFCFWKHDLLKSRKQLLIIVSKHQKESSVLCEKLGFRGFPSIFKTIFLEYSWETQCMCASNYKKLFPLLPSWISNVMQKYNSTFKLNRYLYVCLIWKHVRDFTCDSGWWDYLCKICSIFSHFVGMSLLVRIFPKICVRNHQINLLRCTQAWHKKGAEWRLSRGWKRLIRFKILSGLQNSVRPKWWHLLPQVFVASFHSFKTALIDFSQVMLPLLCSVRLSNCYGLLVQKKKKKKSTRDLLKDI